MQFDRLQYHNDMTQWLSSVISCWIRIHYKITHLVTDFVEDNAVLMGHCAGVVIVVIDLLQ